MYRLNSRFYQTKLDRDRTHFLRKHEAEQIILAGLARVEGIENPALVGILNGTTGPIIRSALALKAGSDTPEGRALRAAMLNQGIDPDVWADQWLREVRN